jgi:hypothetical protein
LHEYPAYSTVLDGGVYRDRANADNGGALVEKVAAYDLTIGFGYHRIEFRVA